MQCFPRRKKEKKKLEKDRIFLVFLTVFSNKKEEEKSRRPQKRKRAGMLNMYLFLLRLMPWVSSQLHKHKQTFSNKAPLGFEL